MGEKVPCEQRERTSTWVSLALDGRLSSIQSADLEQHLAACAACRAEARALRRASDLLTGMPMAGPAYGFSLRFERRLAKNTTRRRHLLRGMALLTSSVSIVGVGAAAILVLGLGLAALLWLVTQPAGQQASISMSQIAAGLGLMGKGASLFLKDFLLRCGLPVALAIGGCLAVSVGIWVWLVRRRLDGPERKGYA